MINPLDIDTLPSLFSGWRERQVDRDMRHDLIDDIVAGRFEVFDPDEERVKSRSPNMVQVALEDTAEAASLMPTVRVQPHKGGVEAKDRAQKQEKIAGSYMSANGMDLQIPRTVMDMAAYGAGVWTVTPNTKERRPMIERRDPRTCYPEPGWRPGDTSVKAAMFVRDIYFSQLPDQHKELVLQGASLQQAVDDFTFHPNTKIVLVEYYDETEIVLAALYETAHTDLLFKDTKLGLYPVELERVAHRAKVCPVVIGPRITLDGEWRGQFDQVLGMLDAHIRLMGMVLDYADQAVYSDVWVRDLIGEMPFGGGSYIELGPQGAIGRVPPAVNSLNIQADLAQLIDGIHLGGRWPKVRPGEVDQSIASAKFLEASAGMMNTAIRTYHQILQKMLEQAIRIAFNIDKGWFSKGMKMASGVLHNQEFLVEYSAKDIDPRNTVRIEYGLGLGRDPAQSAVLHLQYEGAEIISKEFVQENVDGLTDVSREQARIDAAKLRAMIFAKLLMSVEQGAVPDSALIEITRKREQGEDLLKIYEEHIVKPKEEAAASMVPTGLGAPVPPGPPGVAGPGGQPPAGPQPGAGPAIPAPPTGTDLLSRLSQPTAGGGMLGSQVERPAG